MSWMQSWNHSLSTDSETTWSKTTYPEASYTAPRTSWIGRIRRHITCFIASSLTHFIVKRFLGLTVEQLNKGFGSFDRYLLLVTCSRCVTNRLRIIRMHTMTVLLTQYGARDFWLSIYSNASIWLALLISYWLLYVMVIGKTWLPPYNLYIWLIATDVVKMKYCIKESLLARAWTS